MAIVYSSDRVRWAVLGRRLGRSPAQCYNSFYAIYIDTHRKDGHGDGSMDDGSISDNSDDQRDIISFTTIETSASTTTPAITTTTPLPPSKSPIMTMELDYDHNRLKHKSRVWDGKEDAVLMELVQKWGNDWKKIGQSMARTNVQVGYLIDDDELLRWLMIMMMIIVVVVLVV